MSMHGCVLTHLLEKFSTLFGLQVSFTVQKKDIALDNALSAVDAAKQFFKRTRSDENFNKFYDKSVADADKHNIGHPELPRYRRRPTWFENWSDPHVFTSAKAYFRYIYFEAGDLLHAWRIRRKI